MSRIINIITIKYRRRRSRQHDYDYIYYQYYFPMLIRNISYLAGRSSSSNNNSNSCSRRIMRTLGNGHWQFGKFGNRHFSLGGRISFIFWQTSRTWQMSGPRSVHISISSVVPVFISLMLRSSCGIFTGSNAASIGHRPVVNRHVWYMYCR